MNQIVIAPEVLERFHELATTTHRTDADLIDEALNSYLAADRHYLNVLLVRISGAAALCRGRGGVGASSG
ncbi:MAG: hypothetical protein IPG13_15410 [Rhodocyclaceae bacterium]|nr:hypothetical protein [Rhodocyclaceae bacterium]